MTGILSVLSTSALFLYTTLLFLLAFMRPLGISRDVIQFMISGYERGMVAITIGLLWTTQILSVLFATEFENEEDTMWIATTLWIFMLMTGTADLIFASRTKSPSRFVYAIRESISHVGLVCVCMAFFLFSTDASLLCAAGYGLTGLVCYGWYKGMEPRLWKMLDNYIVSQYKYELSFSDPQETNLSPEFVLAEEETMLS